MPRNPRKERLCDGMALRVTPSERQFLEKLATERGVPLGEGIRQLIDQAMSKAGMVV
jgi:hypothetical protein